MTYENYDPCFPDQPVVDLYLPIWANQPSFHSKPAFIWTEDGSPNGSRCSSLTYSQLNSSAQSISNHLLTNLKRRDTVLILCSPGLQLVQILFGCQRAGLLCIPIFPPDPSFSKQNHHHLTRVLLQTNPKAAIANQDYITSLQGYFSSSSKDNQLCDLLKKLRWISIEGIENNRSSCSNSSDLSSTYFGCKTDDVYLIQYTSGATGIPKPVLVTAGAAAHNVRTARKAYDLHPSSVIVSWLPQYHDCGLMFLLLTVISGATCVLTSPSTFVNRPRIWLELITNFKATCTPVPSFTLPLVIRRGGIDRGTSPISLWSLRNLIIINEPIYKNSVDEFIREFAPMGLSPSCISPSYGLAENCTFVSTSWRTTGHNISSFLNVPSYKMLIPSARLASANAEGNEEEDEINIIVVNEETLEPVEDGIEGEIWVASASNASGYLGYPSLTREKFQARLKGSVSPCYVRTGDRGVIRGEDRYLFVMGRTSDTIKVQGDIGEIHPHFLEAIAYNSSPKHLRAGCIAALGISQTVVIIAEMQRSEESDAIVLRRLCEGIRDAVLKEENVEVGLVVLVKSGSVPKTTSGKIQRWIARDKLMRGELRIVTEMKFGTLSSYSSMSHAKKLKENVTKGRGNMVVRDRVDEEEHLSFSNISGRLSLLSFL
ncbi:hypothetical protein AQUCO_00700228v1 [Aquilegia coerulea]|uniref:AMP-dependent synthetase/ligase domain-containing protein n=1 Tax=Aquilegia coerulea TaxID=218851 RepID=A0A2G5EJ21_AQUCA|nr:hypothetical protein AQUCO_00700228v1 [Aquilegia coerulea]